MVRLQHKVSASLKQALERLKLSENAAEKKGESRTLSFPSLCSYLFYVSVFCPLYHRLPSITIHFLLTVDRKVMLTGEANGWPLGVCPHLCHSHHGVWYKAGSDRATHHNCGCIFLDALQSQVFVSLSVFPEEDNDEIKIGTSCKNGGCTKVGEFVYTGENILG